MASTDRQEKRELEIRSDIDRLLLEFEALRRTLDARLPGFADDFKKTYEELRTSFDPEKKSAA